MHRLHFFPLGNADCCRINLANGRTVLVDYAATRDSEHAERTDLPKELRAERRSVGADEYDVVAFTHLDRDHIQGATDFFYLEHAAKYQGGDRLKIKELWVPAAAITEEGLDGEARTIRQEARHRLLKGSGIRVFSRPERLRDWLASQGLALEDRAHLITDAGQLIPGFSLAGDEVELFVHSPFAMRQDASTVEDRNGDSLAFQMRFVTGGRDTRVLMLSDLPHDVLADMVKVTQSKGNDDRLEWDVVGLPHHCSYKSLSPDKGTHKTIPVEEVAWLYEKKGRRIGRIISTSETIPAGDTDQPPHRQAAEYYRDVCRDLDGEFLVTMEYPSVSAPETLVIKIDASAAAVEKTLVGAATVITSRPAPRAG